MIWIINILVLLSFHLKCSSTLFDYDFANINSKIKNDESLNKLTTEKSILVRVDNFDNNDARRWKMRYFENLKYFKNNGPIIFQMGLEAEARDAYYDFCVDLAKETNGALYTNEHRYYGESYPLPVHDYRDFKNYKYLSAIQNLYDVATLLKELKKRPEYKHSKVVAVGGSYGGNLAAWMRKTFPDLVDAAHASSAPVLAKVDFLEYMEQVSQDFKTYCAPKDFDKSKKIFEHYDGLLKTDDGMNQFKEELNICKEVDLHKPHNINAVIHNILNVYEGQAQYGSPEKMRRVCPNIKPVLVPVPVPSLPLGVPKAPIHSSCYNITFENVINYMKNHPYSWSYQKCNEFGYFKTLSSDAQIFTNRLAVDYFYARCRRVFGPDFGEKKVKYGVALTNVLFGGLTPNVTRVVFVNGDMDPWSRLGITRDLSPEAPARVIHGTSHCRDLFHTNLQHVIEVQELSKKMIKKWIGL